MLLPWLILRSNFVEMQVMPVRSQSKIHGRLVLMRQTSSHDCDVVLVNYHAGRLLTECVQSVLSEQVRHVFVVDNDSHDDRLDQLSASISDVRVTLIRIGQNLGFPSAANIVARVSHSPPIFSLTPNR